MCWDFKSVFSDPKKLVIVCGVSLALSAVSLGIVMNESFDILPRMNSWDSIL